MGASIIHRRYSGASALLDTLTPAARLDVGASTTTKEDPYQQRNLADDASRAKLMGELDGEVLDYLARAKDRYPYRVERI